MKEKNERLIVSNQNDSILQIRISDELANDLLEYQFEFYSDSADSFFDEIEKVIEKSLNKFLDKEYAEHNANLEYDYQRKRKMGEI